MIKCFCCNQKIKVGTFYTRTTAFTIGGDTIKYYREYSYICDKCWYEKERLLRKSSIKSA